MIFKEFDKLFKSEGVAVMECLGRPYHHDWHDVLGTVERADVEEGTVVEVLQKGFLVGGRVLRHARVKISKKPGVPSEGTSPAAGKDPKEGGGS